MATCYKCSTTLPDLPSGPQLSRSETCPSCGVFLRSCKSCRHFAPPNDCLEPQADWVKDRAAANFCEYFMLETKPRGGSDGGDKKPDENAKSDAFDALFKKD